MKSAETDCLYSTDHGKDKVLGNVFGGTPC